MGGIIKGHISKIYVFSCQEKNLEMKDLAHDRFVIEQINKQEKDAETSSA